MSEFSIDKLQLLSVANIKLRLYDDLSIEKNKRLIFIYTPPKVGSTSLVSSFRICASKKCTILHIHNEKMLDILCGIKDVSINEIIRYNAMLGKDIYVIDVYRTPIELKMSMFFERICDYHFNNTAENINSYDTNRIILRFNNIFNYLSNEDYFKDVYNVELPDAFPFDKKYMMVEKDRVKYIKLRLCDSDNWNEIIKQIIDIDVKIIKDYETEQKDISVLYKTVKDAYNIPANKLKDIGESQSFLYYNTEEERKTYLEKWKMKESDVSVAGYTEAEYDLYKTICGENKWIASVQLHHYIDEGCCCNLCENRRNMVLERIKNGEITSPRKIVHDNIAQREEHIKAIKTLNRVNQMKQIMMNNMLHLQKSKQNRNSSNIVKSIFTRNVK